MSSGKLNEGPNPYVHIDNGSGSLKMALLFLFLAICFVSITVVSLIMIHNRDKSLEALDFPQEAYTEQIRQLSDEDIQTLVSHLSIEFLILKEKDEDGKISERESLEQLKILVLKSKILINELSERKTVRKEHYDKDGNLIEVWEKGQENE